MDRISTQIQFILEIDKLKRILRRNHISDGSRVENDAEHSWYFSLIAIVLAEYANEKIDLAKVVRMALIHDLVEIDAGDTFIYDDAAKVSQKEREEKAAERIYNLLPPDQSKEMLAVWEEFEACVTPEAQYARSIDRFSAIILNYASNGKTWKQHNVDLEKIMNVNKRIENGSKALWDYTKGIIDDAVRKGMIEKSRS
jgi:putative hydrolases of HD superfamily